MAQEVLPDALMQLGFGCRGSNAPLSAAEPGHVTELARGPLAVDDMRARLNLRERGVRDFLAAGVALGMLRREQGTCANHARDRPLPAPGLAHLHGRHAGDDERPPLPLLGRPRRRPEDGSAASSRATSCTPGTGSLRSRK